MDARLSLRTVALLLGLLAVSSINAADPAVRIDQEPSSLTISHLSWDTEGGPRTERNLLREPIIAVRADPDVSGGFRLSSTTGDLRLPFNPVVASTTIIPTRWHDDGTFELPAILNAPDFGPLVVTQVDGPAFRGRFEGDRLYSASGSPMGRIEGERIYDASGRPIGRADGLRRMQLIAYFFFFM